MVVKDLFGQCDPHKIYCFLKDNHNLGSFSEHEFNKRLDKLLANTDEKTEDLYLICSPYISMGNSHTDRDVFLVIPNEVMESVSRNRSPFDTMMLCDRRECDCTSIANVLNANVCPLSASTFHLYEICADIFFSLAVSVADVEKWNRQQALAFIQNIKDTFTYDPVPSKMNLVQEKKKYCRDVESSIEQNTLFYYPYYVSVANHMMH